MGYSTKFEGSFGLETYLDDDTINLIQGLNKTRRMKRDTKTLAKMLNITEKQCKELYLEEGQLYIEGTNDDDSVINVKEPPIDQPSLFCKWKVDIEDNSICWDGSGDFFYYFEWLNYLMEVILIPRGYVVNGKVRYIGDDFTDMGIIEVRNNNVTQKRFVG